MTKAVSNRDICFVKAELLLFCKHGHFSHNFTSHGLSPSPNPLNTIRVKSVHGCLLAQTIQPMRDQRPRKSANERPESVDVWQKNDIRPVKKIMDNMSLIF